MRYIADTDWIVDGLFGVPTALAALDRAGAGGLAVSIVTLGEVFEGAYRFPDPETHLDGFRRFLAGYTVLPLTEPIMEIFARNRALLRRQGQLIPDLDLLIAATAISHGLTLMTRNRRHFARITDLQLIES